MMAITTVLLRVRTITPGKILAALLRHHLVNIRNEQIFKCM